MKTIFRYRGTAQGTEVVMKFSERERTILPLLAVVILTLAYRALSIGSSFYTDEAWYEGVAFFALKNALTGSIDPRSVIAPATTHTLNLYPLLMAPVWLFEKHAIFATRCVDSVVMALAMACLFCFLRRLCGSTSALIATVGATLLLNHPLFIDAGAKNAYAPGLACLFLSFLYAAKPASPKRALIAGGAFALAVLFRESLLPFALAFLALAIMVGHFSFRDLLKAVGAGALVGVSIITLLARLRAPSIVEGLRAIGTAYVLDRQQQIHFHDRIFSNLESNARIFFPCISFFGPLLVAWVAGLVVPSLRKRIPGFVSVSTLGLLIVATPVFECFFKHSYPYHFSIFAVGLSILCALGCLVIFAIRSPSVRALALSTTAAASILLFIGFTWPPMTRFIRDPRAIVATLANPESSASNDNFYLSCARTIRRASGPGERLLTSGFTPGLFAASRRLPAVDGVLDASWFRAAYQGEISPAVREQFARSSPSIIAQGQRTFEKPDSDTVISSLGINFPADYSLISLTPMGKRDYGFIRARLFRKRGNDSLVRIRIPSTHRDTIRVSTSSGSFIPWGEVAPSTHREFSLRILPDRNPQSSGNTAIVRPILDDEIGELALSAWQTHGPGWREWEHGGRLISSTPGESISWAGTTRGATLTFLKDPSSGKIEISIDGETSTVDLYAEAPTWHTIPLQNKEIEHLALIPSGSPDVVISTTGKPVSCLSLSSEPPDALGAPSQPCPSQISASMTVPLRR